MAKTQRTYAGRRKRPNYDWVDAVSQFTGVTTASQSNVTLLSPVTGKEEATVIRIVGSIYPYVDMTGSDGAAGSWESALHLGIQVVNRAAGSSGTARSPATSDDREGKEWMWLRTYATRFIITSDVQIPPDWYIPLGGVLVGDRDPSVDIKVKRRLDLSQDELILSAAVETTATGITGVDWFMRQDLRILLQYV